MHNVRKTDFKNLYSVIALANSFGAGQTVFFRAGNTQFSLTHTAREDMWKREDVIVFYQTI